MKLTKKQLKKYMSIIGRDSFCRSIYYTKNNDYSNIIIKVLCGGVWDLQEKVNKSRELRRVYDGLSLSDKLALNDKIWLYYLSICK